MLKIQLINFSPYAQVAFEDFQRHMHKMYEQFEQQRADDIVDPKERQQRPISTISGINDAENQKPAPKSTVKISELSDAEAAGLKTYLFFRL